MYARNYCQKVISARDLASITRICKNCMHLSNNDLKRGNLIQKRHDWDRGYEVDIAGLCTADGVCLLP